MLRSYLIIALRNLKRNKGFSFINILGLAIGITASLFIFQYVLFERSYDRFHKNGDQIYRLIQQLTFNNIELAPESLTMTALGPALKRQLPEVIEYARLYQDNKENFIVSYHPEDGSTPIELMERRVFYADASFMRMFSFPMLMGEPETLTEPNNLLISENLAKKIFGPDWRSSETLGKTITLNGEEDFIVSGIFQNVPGNSHIKFDVLASIRTFYKFVDLDTTMGFSRTYLMINQGADIKKLETKIKQMAFDLSSEYIKRNQYNIKGEIYLQPIKNAHLHSFDYQNETEVRGSLTTVRFLTITACFILILAWINYINLATAWAIKRAKEVGIRKVIGAQKRQLIKQFLLEALLINFLSIIIALSLYQTGYSFFINLVGKSIPISSLIGKTWFLAGLFVILMLGTLLSGGYPAFILSSYKVAKIVKVNFHSSRRGKVLRKSLIVFQFVISIGLITGTFFTYNQLKFMKSQEKGFDISQKLIIRAPRLVDDNYRNRYEEFKQSVKQIAEVNEVTASLIAPGDAFKTGSNPIYRKGEPDNKFFISVNCVDEDYLETYGIRVLYGRAFSREFVSDKTAAIITKSLAMKLGYDPVETALQDEIVQWDDELHIIGIIEDIKMTTFKHETKGIMFILPSSENRYIGFKGWKFNYFTVDFQNTSDISENISRIEKIYKDSFSGNPFDYFFLDQYFNDQYKAEKRYTELFTASSCLSILIACLGLFGLSKFLLLQRTKEIGIRKVLGAPLKSILIMLSQDYIKLIIISGIIAIPISYAGVHNWLENYAYRTNLSWHVFLIPVLIVIGIALLTISYQSIKTARTNPAHILQDE
jgi:putative ABC transport system permease protein